MHNIEQYLDRCIGEVIKPRKSIFFAVDGVAPRAKLNQQRGRRFRSGTLRDGGAVPPADGDIFDSNCITPGTEFMHTIDLRIREYLEKRAQSDPNWANLEIIYSGHDTPLEGEHKILQHIRKCRASRNYVPNQRHCLVGQDADLIMLGLATHEPHFTILREVLVFPKKNQSGAIVMPRIDCSKVRFQLLHLSVLREYIEVEFCHGHRGPPLDRERLVDDFVFLTFLVGNDFIPHIPSMDIGENAFDIIFNAYKLLQSGGQVGYIVENGEIGDYDRLEKLFAIIGGQEEQVLRLRDECHKQYLAELRVNAKEEFPAAVEEEHLGESGAGAGRSHGADLYSEQLSDSELSSEDGATVGHIYAEDSAVAEASKGSILLDNTIVDIEHFDEEMGETVTVFGGENAAFGQYIPSTASNSSSGNYIDTGKISEDWSLHKDFNYRDHHYKAKFNVDPDTPEQGAFIEKITEEYLKGLLWCLAYYYKGCPSWSWYYPYYYGPTLIDMKNLYLKRANIRFQLDEPFTPFQQLLGCLPPTSSSILPAPYQQLMTDPTSPIADFYPSSFVEDMDGKKYYWEAVVLLKFIDAERLREAEKLLGCKEKLTADEVARNSFRNSLYYRIGSENQIVQKREIPYSIEPTAPFKSALVGGTVIPFWGFPSLRSLPIQYVYLKLLKKHAYSVKYKTLILGVSDKLCSVGSSHPSRLVGRSVYVNYPLMHEAVVIAVSTQDKRYMIDHEAMNASAVEDASGVGLDSSPTPLIEGSYALKVKEINHTEDEQIAWREKSILYQKKHLVGGRQVGTAGLALPNIHTRLIVAPVIGKRVNSATGKVEIIYSDKELDEPLDDELQQPDLTTNHLER
ncbi:XRN2 [Symbiodinium microadriaticum]|nr:XRN2 [Symbiodinium microadriaticum]